RYIGISQAVRAKFLGERKGGATFIDLFSGPGRARIREETSAIDGSAVAAWKYASNGKAPFTKIYIADAQPVLCDACETRLARAGAPVRSFRGVAVETVDQAAKELSPHALHFALLDPYNLESLSFSIIQRLAAFERMDIIVHVSALDFQRN